jgi:ElaB/YqjD/DUF883 family membrane-anchored ribosome-binding protein
MNTIKNAATLPDAVDGTATSTVEQASSGAHQAIERVVEATIPAIGQLASGAHHAVDRLAGAANQAAESIEHRGTQLRGAQQHLTDSCRSYVREKPIAAIGIAIAAGVALNWLLTRR